MKHAGIRCEGAGEGNTLLHATEFVHVGLRELGEADEFEDARGQSRRSAWVRPGLSLRPNITCP